VDPVPFLQLTNIGNGGVQQGIMDLVFDPSFATNRFYYVFYTLGSPNKDRVSRFTANADASGTVSGSEVVLYQDPLNAADEHHGGALNFGNDGKLYITTGEHFTGVSQQLDTPRGKILRINKDGTIPTDNPFYDGSGPNVDSIWARGLRNPFRAFFDSVTNRLYVADVGGNDPNTAQEEVNVGAAGANYGWPDCEGACGNPAVTDPIYSYPHNGRDASITGGFIYRGNQFPSEYYGNYFFADYAQNWIRRLTFDAGGNVSGVFNFEPLDGSVDGPYGDIVHLSEGPDGALYYVDLGYSDVTGASGVSKIRRIRYVQSNQPPVAVAAANPSSGPAPLAVAFSSAGSFDPEGQPVTYSWTFGDGTTSTAPNPSHTYTVTGQYVVRLSVSDGVSTTLANPLTVAVGNPPSGSILSPQDGALFRAGDVIAYSGDGVDPEDGALPASAFTWSIDFLHEGHVHPGVPITGIRGGSFTIPTSGHDFSGNTRYRITLTVTDSNGLTDTRSVIVYPDKVTLTFQTVPGGLTLYLDGIARTAPFTYDTLIGFTHTIDARNQGSYAFSSWSDGGASPHNVTVPAGPQTYTATFSQSISPPGLVAAWGFNEGTGTTTADASPNANTGTLVNGPTWTTGHTGGALQFDGSNDRVRVEDSNSLDLTGAATFEAWVYPTAAPSGWRTILQKEVDSYFFTASGGGSGNQPAAGGTFNGACCTTTIAPSALTVNAWTHLAATYDGGQLRFYVNGAQVAATIVTGSLQVNGNPLWIGGNAVYGEHFQGKLDDVRVYNRALTAAEIQQDMAAGIP
jgi:glucose/arabinose dehydrogenase